MFFVTLLFCDMKNFLIKYRLLVTVVLVTVIGIFFYDLLIVQRRPGINVGTEINSVSFSSNDRYLAVTTGDGVQVYDVATEKLYKTVMTLYGYSTLNFL